MIPRRRDGLIVLGAGGHAKVVIATALEAGLEIAGLYDDDERKWGSCILGVPVRGPLSKANKDGAPAVIAVGDNRQRRDIATEGDFACEPIVHPRAIVHPSVRLGPGTVVFAGAVLQPCVTIGRHVIVNTLALIDHDSHIDDFVHCGPGTRLAGSVSVGEGALLGVGSNVVPGVRIGEWTTLGAGSTAIDDIPPGVRAVGTPARQLPGSTAYAPRSEEERG